MIPLSTLSSLKLFQYQETSCLGTQKNIHLLFCVFQTKFSKAVNIFCRLPECSEMYKCSPHTRLLTELLVIKKWQPLHFLSLGLFPLCSKKFCTPQVTQFLEGPTPAPFIRWARGSNYVYVSIAYYYQNKYCLYPNLHGKM